MSDSLTVSLEEIVYQVKCSGQLSTILEGIVIRKAIAAAAAAASIQAKPEELQQAADAIRVANNLHRTEDTWAWLQKQGLSLDEFEAMIHDTVLSTKLAQDLFADKVEPFFIQRKLDYSQVVMYEVVLEDEDLAMELFYALQEGELSFHSVAHQYIRDSELRRSGGYRGLLYRTDLSPKIAAAVFAATPPQLLKPILSSKGVHLIFVEEFLQSELDSALRYQILSNLFTNWLQEQIKQYKPVLEQP
ncbi:MAG: peptidylprolyl isomerase [Oscillatoriophycideae cyanobacterium NC_groundwater_1537_Pr4_S-0.65um_50_18]|nr:peptidylprolyl isomerase [Oscillatoriophycideae cyanobacterium NC_groundwater_1537_Pr4_S-0.65um_50_18]